MLERNSQYNYTVFITRAQPIHYGHLSIINKALECSEKLIILVGSADAPRTIRNPFTFEERDHLISTFLQDMGIADDRIYIYGVNDHQYSETNWIAEVQNIVYSIVKQEDRIALIGHEKDHTSYYLKMFPQWSNIAVPNHNGLNASDIRELLYAPEFSDNVFDKMVLSKLDKYMPTHTRDKLLEIVSSQDFDSVVDEYDFIQSHKQEWSETPYPVIFQTTDAVVECAGHILLVQRRNIPGKGLWAFPGGYLNANETLEEGMLRELKEETKISISKEVLRKSITEHKRYDAVNRSDRGRIITEAFHIVLSSMDAKGEINLPRIKGSDDAAKARWFPIEKIKLMRTEFFEDHFSMCEDMLGFSKEF